VQVGVCVNDPIPSIKISKHHLFIAKRIDFAKETAEPR